MLQDRIEELNNMIVNYSVFIEYMLDETMKADKNKNIKRLEELIEHDEHKANVFELDIDNLCITTIAQYDPVAIDLRIILMILKINYDLERMGDHIVNISESLIEILNANYDTDKTLINDMAELIKNMIKNSITSFVNKDADLAVLTISDDKKVDECRKNSIKLVIDKLKSDTKNVDLELHYLRITNNLERIGDLITNICEDVVFITKGKIIKHRKVRKD